MATIFAESILEKFNNLTKKPEKFLSNPNSLTTDIQDYLKDTYDFTKKEEKNKNSNTLNELIVKNFDNEQIWQQIELQNDTLLNNSILHISRLTAAKDTSLWFDIEQDDDKDDEEPTDIDTTQEENPEEQTEEPKINGSEVNSSNESDYEDISQEKETKTKKPNVRPSIVDDDFFKLGEMEEFLKSEERNKPKRTDEDDSEEESIDLFDPDLDDDESDEENNPKYKDFFGDDNEDETNENMNGTNEDNDDDEDEAEDEGSGMEEKLSSKKPDDVEDESSDSEDDSDTEHISKDIKSSYEIREERLQKKIKEIEEKALEQKPWQLKGEVTASNRPQNSLLEEFVEFDLTTRPAPVITQETTYRLEDVIKQRIKDKAFDDVERKIKPVEEPTEYRKKLVLDQEKSKQSLSQIYESEYLKQKEALDPEANEKPEEEPPEHKEIKKMMKDLFSKLDALSNFHYTPKPVTAELRVINNLPAINMEEVAPVAVSDATLLAPEEIKNKPKGDVLGKGERTKTDKKRERRKKKLKQKIHAEEKQKKESEMDTSKKFTKKKASNLVAKVTKDRNVSLMKENSKAVKSSTAFFNQLEDEVKSHIKSTESKKRKKDKPHIIAKKIKL